jgi:hypothetical protein
MIEELVSSDSFQYTALAAASNTTNAIIYTKQQIRILTITKGTASSLSLTFSLCYIIYVLIRSIYSFPFSSCCMRPRGEKFNFRNLVVAMTTQCYLLSRPITRIIFCLQVAECFDDSQVLIELAKLSKIQFFCIYQAIVFQYFGLVKMYWELIIAFWMLWILVLQRKSKLI